MVSIITLVALLLDGARLEIQYPAAVGRLLRRQLLPHLLDVVRVDVVEEAPAVPLVLGVVQHWRHRVGHVDDSARITASLWWEGRKESRLVQFSI